MQEAGPFWLAGVRAGSPRSLSVEEKLHRREQVRVCAASAADFDRAIAAAHGARRAMAALPSHVRAGALRDVAGSIERDSDELARLVVVDSGKPLRDARAEVSRAVQTFLVAAEEAMRIGGEVAPLDTAARTDGYRSFSRRVPVGVCSFITPFNFPLNLVAHKVAPAIAAGCPFVLKPSDKAPLCALRLGAYLAQCDLPAGAFSILPALVDDARAMITDNRPALLSFTGSSKVGWQLKCDAGRKRVVLELGGDAAAVVCPSADVDHACARITLGAFGNSGQSCISVQRVLVHDSRYDQVRDGLVERARALSVGDPMLETTQVGPLITPADAVRIERWIANAAAGGARILCGGTREGNIVAPTLLENVPPGCELASEEVFGPVACLESFDDYEAVLDRVNASRFGLQAGVFTNDIREARRAWEELEVGAVILNDAPTFRTESMPYGGVKDSGLGREGIRSSIMEMTEPRLLVEAPAQMPPRNRRK